MGPVLDIIYPISIKKKCHPKTSDNFSKHQKVQTFPPERKHGCTGWTMLDVCFRLNFPWVNWHSEISLTRNIALPRIWHFVSLSLEDVTQKNMFRYQLFLKIMALRWFLFKMNFKHVAVCNLVTILIINVYIFHHQEKTKEPDTSVSNRKR